MWKYIIDISSIKFTAEMAKYNFLCAEGSKLNQIICAVLSKYTKTVFSSKKSIINNLTIDKWNIIQWNNISFCFSKLANVGIRVSYWLDVSNDSTPPIRPVAQGHSTHWPGDLVDGVSCLLHFHSRQLLVCLLGWQVRKEDLYADLLFTICGK